MVHFVITLYTLSLFLDLVGIKSGKREYLHFGFIALILTGIFVILAVVSGLIEENRVVIPPNAESVFEIHETMAFISTVLILAMAFWRIGLKNQLSGNILSIYLIVTIIGMISLYAGAFYGGKLVYEYGSGVRMKTSVSNVRQVKPPQEERRPRDDLFYAPKDSTE